MQNARGETQTLTVDFPPHDERKKEQSRVDHDSGSGMQRVETDGAPIRIVDRVSQQVVDIDDHGRNHDHRRVAPVAMVERERYQQRDN